MSFSKEPSFKNQGSFSIMERVTARLIVFPSSDSVYVSGSCFRIAQNLYVTAKHVFKDYIDKFGVKNYKLPFEVWAAHIKEGPEYSIWAVDTLWMCPLSDLAVFHTIPYNDVAAKELNSLCLGLDLQPPNIADRIVGFGHHSPTGQIRFGEDGTKHIEVSAFGAATVGEVREVHTEKRDSVRLPFPCYQVNARFDGGMSGGPVINDSGKVCGVICSNLPPDDEKDEHLSYVATLWPLMATKLSIDPNGNSVKAPYLLLELAKKGIISANGWEKVSVKESIDNQGLKVSVQMH